MLFSITPIYNGTSLMINVTQTISEGHPNFYIAKILQASPYNGCNAQTFETIDTNTLGFVDTTGFQNLAQCIADSIIEFINKSNMRL